MSYCDVSLVRTLAGFDTGQIRDQRIREIRDDVAIPRLNEDIQTRVDKGGISRINEDEDVFYLNKIRDTFRSLGDLNDDAEITVDDIQLIVDREDEDEEDFEFVVDEIVDEDRGEFILLKKYDDESTERVKTAEDIYARYRYAPVNISEPNKMVEIACAQLTGAFGYSNIETSKLKNFSIGDVTIRKQSQGFSLMMDQYTESMRRIVNRELIQFDENENTVEDVIKRRTAGGDSLGKGKNTTGRFAGG